MVEVIPTPIKLLLVALAAAATMAGLAALLGWLRARALRRKEAALEEEVEVLQATVLPHVPDRLGRLMTSVAYRPADGGAAGGGFYDVFELDRGRVGMAVGSIERPGPQSISDATFVRHAVRSYLKAGMGPGETVATIRERVAPDLDAPAAVTVALYDPATSSLAHASHAAPAPLIVGSQLAFAGHEVVSLAPGETACVVTGSVLAGGGDGARARLERLARELGPELTAEGLVEGASGFGAQSADLAACVIRPVERRAPAAQTPAPSGQEPWRAPGHDPAPNGAHGPYALAPSATGARESELVR